MSKEQSSESTKYKTMGDMLLVSLGGQRTQKWLAERTYVSPCAVHQWVTGKCRPSPDRLGHIAAALNMDSADVAHLVAHAQYDLAAEEGSKAVAAYKAWCTLYRFRQLTPTDSHPKDFEEWFESTLILLGKMFSDEDLSRILKEKYPELTRLIVCAGSL